MTRTPADDQPPGRFERRPFFDVSRDLPPNHRVPFEIAVVHRDERILVVDKPHFLSTTPRGRHVSESVVSRLRGELELPDLAPAHRLDRMTAGLLLLVVDRKHRGAYQTLFAGRRVHKRYLAVAGVDPAVTFPRTVESRIVKHPGTPLAQEEPGEPNAVTQVELLRREGARGLYRLTPTTGRTHQLRLHLFGLGLPIEGDNFYPELLDTAMDDYSTPLQLLAAELAFADPSTGQQHRFRSNRRLNF